MQGEDQRRSHFSYPSQTSCELRLLRSILGGRAKEERDGFKAHICVLEVRPWV